MKLTTSDGRIVCDDADRSVRIGSGANRYVVYLSVAETYESLIAAFGEKLIPFPKPDPDVELASQMFSGDGWFRLPDRIPGHPTCGINLNVNGYVPVARTLLAATLKHVRLEERKRCLQIAFRRQAAPMRKG